MPVFVKETITTLMLACNGISEICLEIKPW